MGCGASKSPEAIANAAANQELENTRGDMAREVKLLLLGAGESGKSTVVKQMKVIHLGGYSDKERRGFVSVVRQNALQCSRQLINGADRFELKFEDVPEARSTFPADKPEDRWTDTTSAVVGKLWKDKTAIEVWRRRAEIQINDSAEYFLRERIDAILDAGYVPTVDDIVRTRVRTTGIVETGFDFADLHFRLVDVGGQRNERKKWIHIFEDVTAVIFVVALSEFDQSLFEDESVNRMSESLALFSETLNIKWFRDTSFILFLNKTDILKQKLAEGHKIADYFPDYYGKPDSFDETSEFIRDKFVECAKGDPSKVYPHFTCATDTSNIKFVFIAVKDIILQQNLRTSGFI